MSKRAWIIVSMAGPATLASVGGGAAELGGGVGSRGSWLGEVTSGALGAGLVGAAIVSLLYVLVFVVAREPDHAREPALPEARVRGRPPRGDRAAFPGWLLPLLVAATVIGVERVVAHAG